jgi:hypothetical protein
MHRYRIGRVEELAEEWPKLEKEKVDGTIAPEDFANKLNALVKAQTAVLAVFTIRRDKASTVWGKPLMDLPEQVSQTRQCLFTEQQHSWVEEVDSRATFQRKIEIWKTNGQKLVERPLLTTRSTPTASMSPPSPSPVGRH